jgi:hypothetical protein
MPRATPTLAPKSGEAPPRRPQRRADVGGDLLNSRRKGINNSNAKNAALISADKPITDLQRLFVRHWAAGESVISAATRAGYSDGGSYAYRLIAQPNILKLYNAEKLKYEEASQMTRKKVMDMLLESYECAKMAGEPASMVSAAREVGKMCGYYEPVTRKLDITVSGNVVHDRLNRMSDAELLKLITEQAPELIEADDA